jgi:hypothetical protein
MTKKTCTRCFQEKLLDEFYYSKTKKFNRCSHCKVCDKIKRQNYYNANKDKVLEINRNWIRKNPEKRKEQKRIYMRTRRKDLSYRLFSNLRSRLSDTLRNNRKTSKTLDLLGCSLESFKLHLQSLFLDGMTWDNYGFGEGKWNIDHVKPCAFFDFSNPEHQKICFHYSNLQPLWQIDNIKKSDKILPFS